jgi:hypothetical protein
MTTTEDEETINKERQQELKLNSERFAIFRDKPFWISDVKEHKQRDSPRNQQRLQ